MNIVVRILELVVLALLIGLLFSAVKPPRRRRRHWSTSSSDRGGYVEVRK